MMPRRKIVLSILMTIAYILAIIVTVVGQPFAIEIVAPWVYFLAFLLIVSNFEGLGVYQWSASTLALGAFCLVIYEVYRFVNHFIIGGTTFGYLICLIYILPSLFFAINETLFFSYKLKGKRREFSFIFVNSFSGAIIGMVLLYKVFVMVAGRIETFEQLTYLFFLFCAFYVCMMTAQTFYLVGWKGTFKGTMLITAALFCYEIMDICYLFQESIGRVGDSYAGDLLYMLCVMMIAGGVTYQSEKKYSFEFRKREYTEAKIKTQTGGCVAIAILTIVLSLLNILTGNEALYIVIVLMSYSIMCYLLYAGEYRERQNVILEERVKEKTQELVAINEQLLEAKSDAEEASLAKSEFLANMSHEIRTPINTILGMDEMILREEENPTMRRYALNIQRASKALLSQVNDILDFSKIEAGKLELFYENYNIGAEIEDVVMMLLLRAEAKGLAFNVNVVEDLPSILYGDSSRVRQVVINILTNAFKYTREGGVTLDVNFKKVDDNTILMHIAVTDTGIGIKQEDIKKLFSPFDRIDEQRNRTIEGTGLGMSIVRRLLALMDSERCVESEYGKGSTFSFEIKQTVVDWSPVGKLDVFGEDVDTNIVLYHSSFIAPDARILLVDDTEMNLMVAKGLLKQTYVKIDTALDGRHALGMTEKYDYDLMLIDHRMPVMDGIEMIKALRADENNLNAHKPAIALTANAVAGARDSYIEAGFDDYLVKPVDGTRLEQMLIKYLPDELINRELHGEGNLEEVLAVNPVLANLEEKGYLDIQEGIGYAGSEDMYIEVLKFFAATIDEKSEEIRNYYEAKDWKNFKTKVHALKSTAKAVGAEELSDKARALEMVAGNDNEDYIDEHIGDLLSLFGSYKDKLKFD